MNALEIIDAGMDACESGVPITSNPYAADTPAFRAWIAGFRAALAEPKGFYAQQARG